MYCTKHIRIFSYLATSFCSMKTWSWCPCQSFICTEQAKVKNGEKSFRRVLSGTFLTWGGVWPSPFLILVAKPEWLCGCQQEGRMKGIGCWNWVYWNIGEFRCLLMSLNHWQKCSCYHMLQHDTLMEALQTTITVVGAPVILEASQKMSPWKLIACEPLSGNTADQPSCQEANDYVASVFTLMG